MIFCKTSKTKYNSTAWPLTDDKNLIMAAPLEGRAMLDFWHNSIQEMMMKAKVATAQLQALIDMGAPADEIEEYSNVASGWLTAASEAQANMDEYIENNSGMMGSIGRAIKNTGKNIYEYGANIGNMIVENPWTAGGIGAGVVTTVAIAYYLFQRGKKKEAQHVLKADVNAIKAQTMSELKAITVPRPDANREGRRFANAAQKSQESIASANLLISKVGSSRATKKDFERAAKQVEIAKHDAAKAVKVASASATSFIRDSATHRRHMDASKGRALRGVEHEVPHQKKDVRRRKSYHK